MAIYFCGTEARRQQVLGSATLNGIAFVEVDTARLPNLRLHLLKKCAGLSAANIQVVGEAQAPEVVVEQLAPSTLSDDLTVRLAAAGDLSIYTLQLRSATDTWLPNFDPRLSAVEFTFRPYPPETLHPVSPPRTAVEPEISYLAKDYASFRRLMLDRMAALLPGSVEDQPADFQVTLVELLAYTADRLSYYQDAVATEAYLRGARRRVSLRRHARMLDYLVHEGCNARAWVRCEVSDPTRVQPRWQFSTSGSAPVVFEPCTSPELLPQHNRLDVYAWGESDADLPAGATRATLVQSRPAAQLRTGDVMIFEAITSNTVSVVRHVVRLISDATPSMDPLVPVDLVDITWGAEDALPTALPVSRKGRLTAVAYGNVVLVDQGTTMFERIGPVPGDETCTFQPALQASPVSRVEPLEAKLTQAEVTPAVRLVRQDPRAALPCIALHRGDNEEWVARPDLLEGADRAVFVVESEHDGSARLRFGDGVYGRRPEAGTCFDVVYRIGNGSGGNVGAEAICRVETGEQSPVTLVTNPLPALGGIDPESPDQIRLFAPEAFRTPQRAIAPADYAMRAEQFPGIQRAAAALHWTGSWFTVYLYVDPQAGVVVDQGFKSRLSDYLDQYRLAAYDVEIRAAVYVPVQVKLAFEVTPGYVPNAVFAALAAAVDTRGFFFPDRWTFGQPVYISQLHHAALAVPGVASVRAVTLQDRRKPSDTALQLGVLPIDACEVARLDDAADALVLEQE